MRKIKFVAFHNPLFIPELGNVGENLPSPKKTIANLQMWYDEGHPGVTFSGGGVSGFIPDANCKVYLYGPEEKPAAKGKG